MDTRKELIQEFQMLWQEKASKISEISDREEWEWTPDYGAFLDEKEETEKDFLKKHLEPFLFQYELALQWLAYLHLGLDDASRNRYKWIGIPNLLIGNAHVYGVSIRKLILSGLDVPARALLRAFIETLDVIIIFLDDPALANKWAENTNDAKGASMFWRKHLRAEVLHKKLKDIDSRFDVPQDISDSFFAWRKSLKNDHSQAVHPHPAAVIFSMYPAGVSDEDQVSSGLFGKGTRFSVRTLRDGTRFTYYFSLVALKLISTSPKGNPLPSISDEVKASIIIGQDILQTLMTRYWDNSVNDISHIRT